jgi:zinc protease
MNYKKIVLVAWLSCSAVALFGAGETKQQNKEEIGMVQDKNKEASQQQYVAKKVLDNGLTVLVRRVATIPKVSIYICYNVGSKDEKDGEKGIAHLIEHMIFKGTQQLSESDINVIVHMLSGDSNAFTTPDHTGYYFDMPVQNWKKVLPIIADCMTGALFKDEHLNSEMKAVIQELKMVHDQHTRSLLFDLMGIMFPGHPYHYPLIGYKQDLWTVRGKDLLAFYKKHYWPNNAVLVVTGDVEPDEVFELAQQHFGSIPANKDYKREHFDINDDIVSRSISLYRDVQLPTSIISFRVPGTQAKVQHVLDVIALILTNSKSSRLYKKLVDELQLVTSISAFNWGMLEHGMFAVLYEPKRLEDEGTIEKIIFDELHDIAVNGITESELSHALKKAQMHYYSKLENIDEQARDIGINFLATGDPEYAFTYLNIKPEQIKIDAQKLIADYMRQTVMHHGILLPLPQEERTQWVKLQQAADELDNKILSARVRTTTVEGPKYAKTVVIEEPRAFDFPKPDVFTLSNGIKVFSYYNGNTPKINLVLSFKAKSYYDPLDQQGLYNFVMNMLPEGTENYTAAELAEAIESRGMSLRTAPGIIMISMLSQDLEKGLELLEEVVSRPTFPAHEIEKVREQILAEIKDFWDNPMTFSRQLIYQNLYKNHPYSKDSLGTPETISALTKKDLKTFFKKYISPSGARLALVGDIVQYDLKDMLESKLAQWSGPEVETLEFPKLTQEKTEPVEHFINRDQVVLCFAGLSVDRFHEDFDKLQIFDQVFGIGSNSRLFTLREQSGLFYVIGGTVLAGADEQPGMVLVKTMVSLDRLAEAEKLIKKTISEAVTSITQEEFMQARRIILNAMVNNFETNASMALTFLFLDRFKLPFDYFDKRAEALSRLTLASMQEAVNKILDANKLITFRIGRVGKKD